MFRPLWTNSFPIFDYVFWSLIKQKHSVTTTRRGIDFPNYLAIFGSRQSFRISIWRPRGQKEASVTTVSYLMGHFSQIGIKGPLFTAAIHPSPQHTRVYYSRTWKKFEILSQSKSTSRIHNPLAWVNIIFTFDIYSC